MLDMYARSLKYLDREQDFIRIGLQILARTTYHSQRPYALANEVFSPDFGEHGHYLQDIINASKTLERPLSAPLNRHFGEVFLDPYIHHFEGTDGFCMSLKLHSQMSTAFEAHEIRVKLVNVDDEQLSSIWLTMEAPELLQRGPNHVVIQTTVCTDC